MRCEAAPSGQAGSAPLHKRQPSPHHPSGFAAMSRSPMPSISPAPVGRSAMTPNPWRTPSAFDDLPALATRPALRSPITASSGQRRICFEGFHRAIHYQPLSEPTCAGQPLRMGLVLRTLSEVSAVMNAVSACDPDRTAAADRGPLPCVCVAWGRALARAGKLPPHHPAHPCSFAAAIASLCHRSLAHE